MHQLLNGLNSELGQANELSTYKSNNRNMNTVDIITSDYGRAVPHSTDNLRSMLKQSMKRECFFIAVYGHKKIYIYDFHNKETTRTRIF